MSTTVTPAVTAAESAPAAEQQQQQEQKPTSTWTPEQLEEWNRSGEIPKLPSKPASAPAKKDPAVADSAPQKKSAVTRSDSAPDAAQQPKPKDHESSKRFQELANENKTLRDRLDALERKSAQPGTREQGSHPAPVEEPKAPPALKQFLEQYFANKANQGKSYEEGVEAWQDARDKFRDHQHQRQTAEAIQREQQRLRMEGATREMQARVDEGKQRYQDFDQKIWPALKSISEDAQIPYAVKAMLNDSDVIVDLVYTLGSDAAEFTKFLELAKTDPGKAIRKLVTTESLVREQLAKAKPAAAPAAAASPRAQPAAETTPRAPAPKVPPEVGGRGAAPEDAAKQAARSGNFSAFSEEMTRRARQRMG